MPPSNPSSQLTAVENDNGATPEAGHPRLILAAGCFGTLVYAMSSVLIAATLQRLSVEFDRNLAECGVMLTYMPIGFVVCTLAGGYLSDRWGQRLFVLIGFAALGAGLAVVAAGRSYGAVGIGLVLIGMSGGFVESPISAVTANAFPRRRAQALNVLQIFFNIGAFTGPAVIAAALWLGWGWRAGFAVMVGVAAAAFVLSLMGMPSMRRHRATRRASGDGEEPIRWGIVSAMTVAIFLYVGGEMTVAQWSAKYAHEVHGVPESRAALMVSGFWLGMMIGRVIYIRLVEWAGHLIPILLSAVLASLAAIGMAVAPTGTASAIACCLTGLCLGGSWPTILAYAAHRGPGRTGTVFGILVAGGALGWLTMPMLAGWVAEHSAHGLRAAMALGALFIFIEGVVILVVLLRDRLPQNRPSGGSTEND